MTDLKKVVGYKISTWTNPNNGVVYPVRRLYVIYPSGADGQRGLIAGVVKCKGDKVFEGLEVGDYVELRYDQYGNCVDVIPCVPESSDLDDFGAIN